MRGNIYISLTKKTSGSWQKSVPGLLCGGYYFQRFLLAQLSGEVLVAGLGGFAGPLVEPFLGKTLGGDGLIYGFGTLIPFVHPLAGAVKFLYDLVASGVVLVLEAGADVLAGFLVTNDAVTVERLPLRLRHEKSAAAPAKLHGGFALDEVQKEENVQERCFILKSSVLM